MHLITRALEEVTSCAHRDRLLESVEALTNQRNYTNIVLKKEKKKYFSNINTRNYTDNNKFWNTVQPLSSNYKKLLSLGMITSFLRIKILPESLKIIL